MDIAAEIAKLEASLAPVRKFDARMLPNIGRLTELHPMTQSTSPVRSNCCRPQTTSCSGRGSAVRIPIIPNFVISRR